MENEKKEKNLKPLYIVGIILLIAVVGLVGYLLGKSGKQDTAPVSGSSEAVAEKSSEASETKTSSEAVKPSKEESSETGKESEESEASLAPVKEREEGELATPANSGALAVKGTQLVDQNGNPVQLRGISTHGIAWFPSFVDQNAFREFRENWNVNVMRLAMYTAEYAGYCEGGNQEDLKNIIYRGVQYATDNDMYVIIDWHILHDLTPKKYMDEAEDFFETMSSKYKDYNNVIYEICNEPNGGTTWKEIKEYAEVIIPIIRANDPDAIIIVGTPNWSQRVDEAAADPIKGYDNIMYTLHFYAGTHKDDLRKTMKKAIEDGLPVFVSEFGICDASGNGALDKTSAQKWIDLMDEYGVSYVCWALANKDESAALIKSSVTKTSGFTANDLSESGKWLYETLTGEHLSTVGDKKSDSDTAKEPEKSEETFKSSGLEGTATVNTSWGSGSETFYQYNLELTNPGDSKVKDWAIDIHFSDNIELDSGWNGTYTVNGNTLHIINADHNGTIKAGATLKDMGFIIKGPEGLKIVD